VVTVSIVFNLQLLYVVSAVFITLLVYILIQRHRDRRNRAATTGISKASTEFFKTNGVEAMVTSYAVLGGRRFVVLVESKPTEKLRSSHAIEMGLIDEVRRVTGHTVERVFWRFPAPLLGKDQFSEDLYLAQGIQPLKGGDGYSVTETSWDTFDKAMTELQDGVGSGTGQFRKP
jgi:preprotein translocase subunit SecG